MRSIRQNRGFAGDRLPGLDTLRAVATVLVVLLHAGVPYAVTAMPGLAWPVRHPQPSAVVEVVFWAIAGCVMPIFFWLSGYGAAQSLASRGVREFLRARWQRIGIPLLVFVAVLLPLELYVWLTGWALDGQIPWRKLSSLKVNIEGLWGLSHLWYLEYLLIYCGALVLWDWVRGNKNAHGARPVGFGENIVCVVWRSQFRLVALTAVVAVVLWWSPEVVVGFQHSFFPVPAKFAFSGIFFVAGVITFRFGPTRIGQGYAPMVSAAVVLLAVLPWLHRQGTAGLIGMDRLILVVGLAGFAALMTGGLWDLCLRQQRTCSRGVQFVSAASYWTYLVHHPLVALCHIALRPTGLPALTQFLITAAVTTTLCWVSYQWLVKPTVIGALLNGRSPSRSQPAKDMSQPLRRAA